MIRPVLRMGNPLLLNQAKQVTEFNTLELNSLIADMFDTMEYEGGVGLAAPQIGVSLRVVVFGFDSNERYPEAEAIPLTVLINPVLKFIGDDMENGWEGCLSVPGLRGQVPRYQKLYYSGFDQFGQRVNREVEGFHARVVQHECDHLDGVLYPMRIQDFRQFGFSEEILLTQESVE